MKKKEKHTNKNEFKTKTKLILVISFVLILCIAIFYIINYFVKQNENAQQNDELKDIVIENVQNKESPVPEIISNLQTLKKENEDLIGWIKIDDTNINYPVVQTTNNDYYVDHNFNGQYNAFGTIFLDKDCSIEKPTNNLLIYGHRNRGGDQMFETLTKYKDYDFYNNHKTFEFYTLNEKRTYEIIAIFQSQIYYKNQNVFKYYFFKGADNEKDFMNYVNNVKKLSMYKIDNSATWGDELITLSTCDYHINDGRFVVVAKKIAE